MEQHRCFWERPVSCLPTIIKIGQTSFAMFRDPTNKPWARCLCILKSSLGRVLQRFRKNGVIEGDGRGSSAGRQQPPQRPQADGSRRCRQLRAQADGSRRAPGQEAPADVRARAGSPCRRARARRLTGARAGSPCMRAHSAGQRARAPCGLCLPARARPVRAVPACARAPVRAVPASARAPRAGSAGQRARARACCAGQRARPPCVLCRPARARRVRTVPASARAPRADCACLRARAPCGQCRAGQRARAPCGCARARAGVPAARAPVRAVPAAAPAARPVRAVPACARAPCGQCRPTWARRQTAADGARAQTAPADLRARADSPCRPPRARRQPLPTCARAPWPTTADVRAGLADHCRRTRMPGPTTADVRAGLADHCRCTRMPGPTTADGRACLGRPLPMHVCLRAGMCAGAWAGPCRPALSGNVRPTCGRALDVRRLWPWTTPVSTGLSGTFSGTRTASKATGTDDVRRRPRDMDGPTGARVLGFRYFTQGTISFVRMRAHARPVAHFSSGTWHSFDPGLGHFFLTRAKQGTRAGGSLAVGHGTRTASKATGTDDVRRRPRDVDGPTGAACWVFVISRKAPSLSCGSSHTLALWHIFHLGLGTVLIRDLAIFLDPGETRHTSRGHHLFRAEARARSPCGTVLIRDLANFDPGLGHFFLTRAKQGTRAGGSPRAVPGERMGIGGGRDESKRQRAESQRIVAARPLCRLQYPVAYLSRLQRILPAARWELYFKAASAARPPRWLGQRHVPLGALGPLLRVGKRTAGVRVASSPDSDLEAFSHNPAHGSFAPLAFQPSAMTNCANQRFLSY
ncbi:UNVERIFIED_CONTAM: hypothetical protein Sindi_2968800 [Sesamum indicum]